jgi:hypothetical protein
MRTAFFVVAGAAVLAGIYGRFKGLGAWPLGVDEFYISRSIDNVLRSGLPRFACGGYYNRGALYQYAVAGLRLLGLGPEVSGRAVAAASSLAVLPAAYLIAKRTDGRLAGLLSVTILSLSVWEIEMGRFARMYAPFQAVFAWYLLLYLRYTVDRRQAALVWMAVLSLIGVLTWEGGVLLGIANIWALLLTLERGRPKRADGVRLAALTVLLGLLYFIGTNDFRGSAADGPDEPHDGVARRMLQMVAEGFAPLLQHHLWFAGWLLLVVLVAAIGGASLRREGFPPGRRWAAVALGAALALAAAHWFAAAAGLYLLLLLSRSIAPPRWPPGIFPSAAAAFLVFWLAFDVWTGVSSGTLVGFPDVFQAVIRPWGRTMPWWSAALGLALLFEFATTLGRRDATAPAAALFSLALILVLAVAATRTERIETRYTFFLYPLLVVLAVSGSLAFSRAILRRIPLAVGAAIPLVCFGATEDFQPRHLAHVDRAEVNFRIGMSPVRAAHYYPRNDVGGAAHWLASHERPGDVVIVGVPNLDPYFRRIDYFYVDGEDQRYDAYVCRDGRTERWTNHPLMHSAGDLAPIIGSGRRILAFVYPDTERRLRAVAASRGWSITAAWRTAYGDADVLTIEAAPGART